MMGDDSLSHVDGAGRASMVDVSAKQTTERVAVVRSVVFLDPTTIEKIRSNQTKKGDVLAVARIAGISASKKTGDLVPLCHPLPLDLADVRFCLGDDYVGVEATAKTTAKTGVEMEAFVAATIAAVTIYDMIKAVDRTAYVGATFLHQKRGGKSGDFENQNPPVEVFQNAVWE